MHSKFINTYIYFSRLETSRKMTFPSLYPLNTYSVHPLTTYNLSDNCLKVFSLIPEIISVPTISTGLNRAKTNDVRKSLTSLRTGFLRNDADSSTITPSFLIVCALLSSPDITSSYSSPFAIKKI